LIEIIPADTRGAADHGWLKAKHSFSFADYYDPERMGFGSIRVINEDRIEPSKGFGTHPHNDMEIVTYIIDGALEHEDSMGNGSVIRAGDVQRMTAGTGVRHSEFNHSENDVVHLLQIWILPQELSLQPGYEQQHFSREDKLNQWRLIASSDGREASVHVHGW
jgi:redox-sensitive bicupin YhaK (pirin superfamily)